MKADWKCNSSSRVCHSMRIEWLTGSCPLLPFIRLFGRILASISMLSLGFWGSAVHTTVWSYKKNSVNKENKLSELWDSLLRGYFRIPELWPHFQFRYKGKSYRATVEVVRTADRVADFCRKTCIKLECCPNLFGPQMVLDKCSENCSVLTKTKYSE